MKLYFIPSYTASVINHVSAKIVLVDTALDSYEMNYDKIYEVVNGKRKIIQSK